IGRSATQKPIDEIARFLVGVGTRPASRIPLPEIIDSGHARSLDLAIEIPSSPLEAVMAAEVWDEIYERLVQLISEHRTTLVFVNTRRLAERLALHVSERLGADQVTSHHGSLSKEKRLDAETRLKEGKLKALVATASLELGIDIGAVDLVCQIGSTRSIATLLQRVGRSGHHLAAVPKGRVFPLSRDELIECAALLRAARERELDRLIIPDHPLDILAQQVVAAVACEEWDEGALYGLVRGAYPYRELSRQDFDAVVQMLADGFTTRRGRRGAYVHYDGVNRRLKARRARRGCRCRCRAAARTSRAGWRIPSERSPGSRERSPAFPSPRRGRSSSTSTHRTRSSASFPRSRRWCWSASSTKRVGCSWCCTRRSGAG